MKYEIILQYIKNEISKNNIKIGEKLPSIRSICDKFQCSKVTAVKAYDILEKEHIIYSMPKSGYYLLKENNILNKNNFEKKIDFSTSRLDKYIILENEFQYCIDEAMKLYKENIFTYSDPQGIENLINVIVKQLQDYQVFTDKKCVFITSGTQQAINILTMMPFPNNKENVLIEQPTYYGVIKSLELNNINAIGIKRKASGIDLDELENIFKNHNIKFFYTIPRFHNPTGFSYSNNDKKEILKLAEKYDVYIVEDDYLADLEINKRSDPIYALDMSSRVIYLKPYSKIILPGLRVAAVVLPKLLVDTFEKYKRWSDLNTSLISQGALEIYIKSGMFNSHRKKIKNIYSHKMSYLNELTKKLNSNNIKWYIPESGFFASFEVADKINIKDIIKRLNSQNVLLKDPKAFYLNNYIEDKLIRLSISVENNDGIKEGINTLIKEIY